MENFVIRLKLGMVNRLLQEVLPILSAPTVTDATLITTDMQRLQKNQYSILAQLSFGAELKVNLHILVSSIKEFSLAATKFNMAAAHGCAISFNLVDSSVLEITLSSPSEEVYKKLSNFYQQIS